MTMTHRTAEKINASERHSSTTVCGNSCSDKWSKSIVTNLAVARTQVISAPRTPRNSMLTTGIEAIQGIMKDWISLK